jgi:hypothetical protein
MAEHLSEIAINSFNYFASTENISPLEGCEAYYLCMVSKRFRLGLIPLDETGNGYKTSARIFKRVGELRSRAMDLDVGPAQAVTALRFEVEYAASSLFYCIYCLGQARQMEGIDTADDIRRSCLRSHDLAGEALQRCLEIYNGGDVAIRTPDLNGSGAEIVRAQFLINIAAWTALSGPVRRGMVGSFSQRNDLRSAVATELGALSASLNGPRSEQFQAEVLAFKIVEGIDKDEARKRLAELASHAASQELALDRFWFEEMVRNYAP